MKGAPSPRPFCFSRLPRNKRSANHHNCVSDYRDIIEISEGQAQIMTKSRWMLVLPMPHTGIMPHPCSAAELGRFGTVIKWTTGDPVVLAQLHGSVVQLVKELGVAGILEVANSVKVAEQARRKFGGGNCRIQEWIEQSAALSGVSFPMPANTLKHLKGFQ